MRPSDERPLAPGPEPFWADAWEIDFASDTGIGGFVRLTLLPNQGRAWWWTSLLTPRLVAVRDHDVPLPRAGLEVRADGLWGELVCETPLEHWSVGLEAFGIAYDEPADAWGDEWGERLPVGLDLEWEIAGTPAEIPPSGPPPGPQGVGFAHPGVVRGEILVGPDRIAFAGTGFRSRASGVLDWWAGPLRQRIAWVGESGSGVVDGASAGTPGGRNFTELGKAPVLVTAAARPPVRLARSLGEVGGPDGGVGWAEWFPA